MSHKPSYRSFLLPGNKIFPRSVAAEILSRVAANGEYGGTAADLDAFIIGVAVRRLVSNYPSIGEHESDWKVGFLLGLNFNLNTDSVPA